ncbi:MAG TPA: glycoside hydrolase domain-containing protein, partial [Paenibacillus sp.]|nr:glycoside hydrolase domain-containing protein [Paenibacillus sp.]
YYASGMHHRGESYGPYTFASDIASALIFKALGAERMYGDAQGQVLYHYLYTRRPDGSLLRNGDSYEDNQHPYGQYWRYSWPWMGAASYFQDPYLQGEFLRNYAGADGTGAREAGALDPVLELLYADPTLEARSVGDLPLTRYFGSPHGTLAARTGWTDGMDPNADDVVADFRVNEYFFGGHQHLDAGAFQIYYKGALALDSGNYALYETPHHMNYSRRTIAHNSMLVYDPAEKWEWHDVEPGYYTDPFDGGKLKELVNDGGQTWPNQAYEPYDLADITDPAKGYKRNRVLGVQFGPDSHRPDYSYLKGDLTGSYSSKVTNYERSFLFLNLKGEAHPAAVLVYDRVTAADPSFKKTWLLHSIQEPAIDGNRTTIVRDTDGYDGKLVNTTLLPQAASITPVGGEGKEFADLRGVNWPESNNVTSSSEVGAWRVEISPAAPAHTDTFLNVMQVMDGATEPLPVERVDAGTMEGARIQDRVALFSKSGDRLGGTVEVAVAGSGTVQFVLADLQAGRWKIKGPGSASGEGIVTEEGGVLSFSGPAGTYSLTYKGPADAASPKASAKDITDFRVEGQTAAPVIDTLQGKVTFRVAYGTDISALTPSIGLSAGASIKPASGAVMDFRKPATFTVRGADGGAKMWKAEAIVDPPSEAKDITAFRLPGQTAPTAIDPDARTVAVRMPYGADVTELQPAELTVSALATIDPAADAARDFTEPATYTVTAQDGSKAVWTVVVTLDPPGGAKDITAFRIDGQTGASVIDPAARTVEVPLAEGTDVSALAPSISVSPGASVDPASGEAQDFTEPATYTVTAQDGTTSVWTVSVRFVRSWYSTLEFVGHDLGSGNTGAVVAEFDLTPLKPLDPNGVNSLLGYADSGATIDGYPKLPISIYFNPDNHTFMARNGGGWTAENPVPIVVGRSYRFRLHVDFDAKTYSVWVKPEGGAETQLGRGLAFRTGATPIDDLGKIYLKSLGENDTFKVEHHRVGKAAAYPTELPTNVAFTDTDPDVGEIAGALTWTPTAPESGVTRHTVYFLTATGARIGSIAGETDARSGGIEIASDTPIPSGAAMLGVYSKNERGESMQSANVTIVDDGSVDNRLHIRKLMDGARAMSDIALTGEGSIDIGFDTPIAEASPGAFKLQRYRNGVWADHAAFVEATLSPDKTRATFAAAQPLPTTDAGSYRLVAVAPESIRNLYGKPLQLNPGDTESVWFDRQPPRVEEVRQKISEGTPVPNVLEVVFSERIAVFDKSDLAVTRPDGGAWDPSDYYAERTAPNVVEITLRPKTSGAEDVAIGFPAPTHTADAGGVKLPPVAALAPVRAVLEAAPAGAPPVAAVWAVHDGERVRRDDANHPSKTGNSAWDGSKVKLFGGRNEVVAFQLIVEAGAAGIDALRISLPGLKRQGGSEEIAYVPPEADPTVYAGRPIQIFSQHYMNVTDTTNAEWILPGSGAGALAGGVGWFPEQLVPENAKPGKGGFPLQVRPRANQGLWIEIYTEKGLPAGTYAGNVTVEADGETRTIPVELELLDFELPDENSMDAMIFYESAQTALYHGKEKDDAYHRLAHRNRVEFVHAYDEAMVDAQLGRFTGEHFAPAAGYEGPGEGVGNRILPRTFYSPGTLFDVQASAWSVSDRWMNFLNDRFGQGSKTTFVYMPDEPDASQHPYIKQVSANIKSNPGPGRELPVLVTKEYTADLDEAIDYWTVGTQLYDHNRATLERSHGDDMWIYNGNRPYAGALIYEAPASDPRATIWGSYLKNIDTYFYWNATHWKHNSSVWRGIDRRQNVWLEPVTFHNRGGMYGNGDGVLVYPGEDAVHPSEDRGVDGPVSGIRLANVRRGLQDHLYMSMLERSGKASEVQRIVSGVVPDMLNRYRSVDGPLGFAETGDAYEQARRQLAELLVQVRSDPAPIITVAGLVYGMKVTSPALTFTVAAVDKQGQPVAPIVRLNGIEVPASADGTTYQVLLSEGEQTITVDAADAAGNRANTQVYTVTYSAEADAEDRIAAYVNEAGAVAADIRIAGAPDFPSASLFRAFDGATPISGFAALGSTTALTAPKWDGDEVIIGVYDGNEVELAKRVV